MMMMMMTTTTKTRLESLIKARVFVVVVAVGKEKEKNYSCPSIARRDSEITIGFRTTLFVFSMSHGAALSTCSTFCPPAAGLSACSLDSLLLQELERSKRSMVVDRASTGQSMTTLMAFIYYLNRCPPPPPVPPRCHCCRRRCRCSCRCRPRLREKLERRLFFELGPSVGEFDVGSNSSSAAQREGGKGIERRRRQQQRQRQRQQAIVRSSRVGRGSAAMVSRSIGDGARSLGKLT